MVHDNIDSDDNGQTLKAQKLAQTVPFSASFAQMSQIVDRMSSA